MSIPDRYEWVAGGALREAIARLHGDWEALPHAARRSWWRSLVVGFAAVLAVTVGLVALARALESGAFLGWEADVIRWFDRDFPVSFSTAMWLEAPGNGFILWALVLYAAGLSAWKRQPLRCIALLLGYTLLYLPIVLGWWMWDRQRPEIIEGGAASPGALFPAFPSGHMVQSVFAYGLLFWFWIAASRNTAERGLATLLFAGLMTAIAIGRLRTGTHWPTDVVAGSLIASIWLAAVIVALRRGEGAA